MLLGAFLGVSSDNAGVLTASAFSIVVLGGLGSALGPLAAGIVIGVSEAVTMAVASPSWAPIVSFSLLILMLLFRPGRAWR